MKKNSINLITLGCSKNTVDSEVLLKQLHDSGFDTAYDSEDFAETVIINTCGFINDAKQESIDMILNAVEAKKAGKIKHVIVFGCLAQRYAEALTEEIPEVDFWFGTNDLQKIVTAAKGTFNQKTQYDRILTTPSHYAWLKIAEGCSRRCSYCAIPVIRGEHISKPIDLLVDEAKKLVQNGVKELLVISQDLTWYGIDLYKKQALTELIDRISTESGAEWIRLHYTFPTGFPLDLLDLMKERSNICNYMDIPLQHINDRILKSMQRGIGTRETMDLVEKFKTIIPDVALRTAFIVGYPGETEKEFLELVDFVKAAKFDRLGVFTYSPEEDTPAFALKDNVSQKEKQRRADYLMKVQQEISLEHNQKLINQTFKILVDSEEEDYFIGRSEFDSPEVDNAVMIEKSDKIKVGEFCNVKIQEADLYDIFGKVQE
ncbi:MAG: 30S ribosomal protein S12 methylthiotransferase RimO [Bacteroidales bacterium]|nr:30S ribosomal protein S12 methylthiotransferase RimO [Bacteroidales bacterium]